MAKQSKQKVTLLIVVGCVIAIVGGQALIQKYRSNIKQNSIRAKAKGNPQAELKIIEYIDFECPACAQGMRILHNYFTKYPGRMYLEVKYFPLPGHKWGMPSARYAECAARQNKFWLFVDILIDVNGPPILPALRQVSVVSII